MKLDDAEFTVPDVGPVNVNVVAMYVGRYVPPVNTDREPFVTV